MLNMNIFAKRSVFRMITLRHHLGFSPLLISEIIRATRRTVSRDSVTPLMDFIICGDLNLLNFGSHGRLSGVSDPYTFAIDTNFQSGSHDGVSDLMISWAR